MAKRKSNEEFLIEVYDLVGDEYTFLDNYIDNKTKIRCRHNTCKHEYEVAPKYFIKGTRCPKCFGCFIKPSEKFIKEFYNRVNNEYTLLSEYINNKIKIKIKHNICNHEYEVTPNKFMDLNRRCPNCASNKKKTHEEFAKRIKEIGNGEYEVLTKYTNSNTKIKVKHIICGNEYEIKPGSFLNKSNRCPNCSLNRKKTQEKFIKDIKEAGNNEYEVLSNYVNNKTKIKIKHIICGSEYEIRPNDFLVNGNRCIKCRIKIKSRAEVIIDNILTTYGINFKREVSFPDCRYIRPLKFDFQIFINDIDFILLEYNGIQHYEAIKHMKQKYVDLNQTRDKIKEKWCKENNITLYIIHFELYSKLDEVLLEILNKYKLF